MWSKSTLYLDGQRVHACMHVPESQGMHETWHVMSWHVMHLYNMHENMNYMKHTTPAAPVSKLKHEEYQKEPCWF